MTDLNKLRALAGVPVDLSKAENARKTIITPKRIQELQEAAKVPQHRGELSPKNKKNMRSRVSCAKKALEYLEAARDELMSLPAIDYMEDIPDVIKQLHHMLHGEDGTGGLHHAHRQFEREYNDMEFPEDLENKEPGKDGNPTEAEVAAAERESAKKKSKNEEKKNVKEALNPAPTTEKSVKSDGLGFAKQKNDPSKENVKPFKLAPGSDDTEDTMYCDGEEEVGEDPRERTPTPDPKLQEAKDGKKPKWLEKAEVKAEEKEGKKVSAAEKAKVGEEDEQKTTGKKPKWLEKAEVEAEEKEGKHVSDAEKKKVHAEEEEKSHKPRWLEKAEVKAEEKEGKHVSKKEEKKVGIKEAQGPLFARDGGHPKHPDEDSQRYPSWGADGKKPVNVVSQDDGPSLYYPDGSKSENASQLSTNPYNESQKVTVPPAIKTALKTEADAARKLAETFTMRKDWDNKNFHENLANAFDTLNGFLDKETVYGIKEAQIFMTSLMSPMMNKIPANVIKFIAAGGVLRSLSNYLRDVKEPTTGVVFQQDSDGTK